MTDQEAASARGGDGPAIEVSNLVKRYPKSQSNAVDGMSFLVRRGEVFGLLGPNGAGKTTTVGVLTTLIRATSGIARVAGQDVAANLVRARALLGVVPQRNNLDRSLSIRQNLVFHAAYHGVARSVALKRAEELLDMFGLAERAGDKPEIFSGGQAQRVMIARALMHYPAVLFLDEPTTGLDPAARLFVWEKIRELRKRGITVLLTTHDMDEAETLADRVGIVDYGRLLALDTPDALVHSLPGSARLEITAEVPGAVDSLTSALSALAGVRRVEVVPASPAVGAQGAWWAAAAPSPPAGQQPADDGSARLRLYVDGDPALLIPVVAGQVSSSDGRLTQVTLGIPSLEDVFLHLTGRTLR